MSDDADVFYALATLSRNIAITSVEIDGLIDVLQIVRRESPQYRKTLIIYLKK